MKKKFDLKKLLKLFLVFFKIGVISFGGGYGMILVMKRELVGRKLATEEEFMDSLVVAQTTPGALAVNLSIAQAGQIAGNIGAVVAFVGVVLPSFLAILFLSTLFNKYKENGTDTYEFYRSFKEYKEEFYHNFSYDYYCFNDCAL